MLWLTELACFVRTLEGYVGEVVLVGVNYNKETKQHQCKIERVATTHNKPTTNPQQTDSKPTTNPQQIAVLKQLLDAEVSIGVLMEVCGYKDRTSFRKSVLNEMLDNEWVAMTHPENKNHRDQRYVITDAGRSVIF